jgi:hypothetical protein
MPADRQTNETYGALYLENNLTPGAFTSDGDDNLGETQHFCHQGQSDSLFFMGTPSSIRYWSRYF